jgi:hypothetical protein
MTSVAFSQFLKLLYLLKISSKSVVNTKRSRRLVAWMQRKALFFPEILGEALIVWCNTSNLLD